jgi:hypothetical protein
MGHVGFVLGIVHPHTDHFGAWNDGGKQVSFGERHSLLGRIDAVKQWITREDYKVFSIDNTEKWFPALQAKSGDLHTSQRT